MAEETKKTKTTKTAKTEKSSLSMPVIGMDGAVAKDMNLPAEIFNIEVSTTTLENYIRVYQQNQRQGTHKAQTRSEVTGSTRKIYKQKGTGGARHGSRKAPIFVGGGVTFGPLPRDYSLKMNKKQKVKALFSALTVKSQEKGIMGLVNEVMTIEPKTKAFNTLMKKNNLEDKKVLIVTPSIEKGNFNLATRNLKNVKVVTSTNLNAMNVLTNNTIIFVEDAIDTLQKHYTKNNEN